MYGWFAGQTGWAYSQMDRSMDKWMDGKKRDAEKESDTKTVRATEKYMWSI